MPCEAPCQSGQAFTFARTILPLSKPGPTVARNAWVGAAIPVGLVGLFAWLALSAGRDLARGNTRDFFEFFSAARAMAEGQDIYASGSPGYGYIYPPLLAFLLLPLARLGLAAASWVWLGVNLAALGASLYLLSRETLRRFGLEAQHLLQSAAALLSAALLADKLRSELEMGQSNLLMLLAWAAALALLDRRPLLAGLALGLGANLKYLTLLAVPYLIIRRRYRAAGATVAATIALALLPAAWMGWGNNLDALGQALGGMTRMLEVGESERAVPDDSEGRAKVVDVSEVRSQSIPSWAARAFGDGDLDPRAAGVTLAVALLFAAAAWWIYHRRGIPLFAGRGGSDELTPRFRAVVALEWAGLVAISLAFGPQTNMRHLVMAAVATTIVAALLLARGRDVRRPILIVGAAVLVAGMNLPPGGNAFRESLEAWRWWSGPSWCLLAMYLALLWTGLAAVPRQVQDSGPGGAAPVPRGG